METTPRPVAAPSPVQPQAVFNVALADGTTQDLAAFGLDELQRLQWQQEQAFARRILDAPKGSTARIEAVRQAYDTVSAILAARRGVCSEPLVMSGEDHRHVGLVVGLLAEAARGGREPRFFEIGLGSGTLMKNVRDAGFPVAGIEVSAELHARACQLLGEEHRGDLLRGDFLRQGFSAQQRYSLIYWNAVFEHIPPDEIGDYLEKIYRLLSPGGQLVTLTPSWHLRPSDITAEFCPPRTEAAGLHLKEYTLREITGLVRQAGFARVATPLVLTRKRFVLWGKGLIDWKRLFEPCLERLPFYLAQIVCRKLGFCCTIAAKP